MKLDKEHIAQIIQERRRKAGLKQSELAEKIGISEKHLSKIETGKNYPALDTFLKILDTLDLTLGDFGLNNTSDSYPNKKYLQKVIKHIIRETIRRLCRSRNGSVKARLAPFLN